MGAPIGLAPRLPTLTAQNKKPNCAKGVYPPQKPANSSKNNTVRFGDGRSGQGFSFRKAMACLVGGLSAAIGTIAVPMGVLQLAVGCIPALHFLWITGLLTLGVPVLGGVGTFMLWPNKK